MNKRRKEGQKAGKSLQNMHGNNTPSYKTEKKKKTKAWNNGMNGAKNLKNR